MITDQPLQTLLNVATCMGSVLDDSWFVVLETLEFLDKLITSPCSPILPSEQVLDNLRLCAPSTTLYAVDISRDPSQAFLSSALSNVPKSSRMLSVSLLSLSVYFCRELYHRLSHRPVPVHVAFPISPSRPSSLRCRTFH